MNRYSTLFVLGLIPALILFFLPLIMPFTGDIREIQFWKMEQMVQSSLVSKWSSVWRLLRHEKTSRHFCPNCPCAQIG